MTLKNILAICDKDEYICIDSDNHSIFIPNEDGEIVSMSTVLVGELLRYIPEEILSATVIGLRPTLERYLKLYIECPTVNTIFDDIGAPFINCDPKDFDVEKHLT